MDAPLTINALLVGLTFAGALWAVFARLQRITEGQRETRILLNVICRHLQIDPLEILSGNDK